MEIDLPNLPFWGVLAAFMAMLFVLVIIHELGHFAAARLARVRVEEFAFGFPPRMFSIRYGETDYSINWLPIGGYVKMLGEEDPTAPGSLASKPAWVRIVVMAAGALMNLLLAVALFSAAQMVPTPALQGRVQVLEVVPDTPAAQAGLRPGDIITRVSGRPIASFTDLRAAVQLNLGSPTVFEIERGLRDTRTLLVTPRWAPPAGQGATGIRIGLLNPRISEVSYPFLEAVPRGIQTAWDTVILTRNGLIQAFLGGNARSAVSGPVGMYQLTEVVAQTTVATGSMAPFLMLMGLISMSLAIFNLLPLPALDGGRILFVLIEIARRGRRISPEREGIIHFAGFVVLMGLIALVSVSEVVRVVNGESLIR